MLGRQSRPLHRLTRLREDPASEWLSFAQRAQVAALGVLAFGGFGLFLLLFRIVVVLLMSQLVGYWGRLPIVLSGILGAALLPSVRRSILRLQGHGAAVLVKRNTRSAFPIDDWSQFEAQPDGRIVSIVGWVRSRLEIEYPVNGERSVGLAMPCEDTYPGVIETLHDFELTDDAGRAIAVRVADARMLGRPNVRLNRDRVHRLLIASLELPGGTVPATMEAFVLRDGDPVMVVGFKHTFRDPDAYAARQTCLRPAIGSSLPRPLLIFPLAAERRTRSSAPEAAEAFEQQGSTRRT